MQVIKYVSLFPSSRAQSGLPPPPSRNPNPAAPSLPQGMVLHSATLPSQKPFPKSPARLQATGIFLRAKQKREAGKKEKGRKEGRKALIPIQNRAKIIQGIGDSNDSRAEKTNRRPRGNCLHPSVGKIRQEAMLAEGVAVVPQQKLNHGGWVRGWEEELERKGKRNP